MFLPTKLHFGKKYILRIYPVSLSIPSFKILIDKNAQKHYSLEYAVRNQTTAELFQWTHSKICYKITWTFMFTYIHRHSLKINIPNNGTL